MTILAFLFSLFCTQLVFAKMEIALVDEVEVTKKESYSLFDIVYLKKGTALELESLKKVKIIDLTKAEIINAVRDNKDKIQLKMNDDFKIKTTKNLSSKIQSNLHNMLEKTTRIPKLLIKKMNTRSKNKTQLSR